MVQPDCMDAAPGSPPRPDDLAAWLAWAERLNPQPIEMGLDRVRAVHQALGLVPRVPVITVGGTNGKGSTCAMLSALLQSGGYRVGCYTSPHLLHPTERVRIDGVPVAEERLAAACARVESARGTLPLTPFEFGTLAALCVFDETPLDALVLEVGLGGRLDAVNVVDADVSVVTSIGIDHIEFLGNTRDAIGFEKAGIFRPGRPALCGDPHPPLGLLQQAQALGAPLWSQGAGYGWSACPSADGTPGWRFWRVDAGLPDACRVIEPLPLPALEGEIQLDNAATALMALDRLRDRLPLPDEALRAGLRRVQLAGRFQRLGTRPDIILDVAHNPHAAQRLAATLAGQPLAGRTLAVLAMLRDKDMRGVVQALAAQVQGWCIAPITERRGASIEELSAALQAGGAQGPVTACTDIAAALAAARADAGPEDRVIVCGSFVTVGTALQQLIAEAAVGTMAAAAGERRAADKAIFV